MSEFLLPDDVTPATALAFGPTAAGATSAVQIVHYWFSKGAPGGVLTLLNIQAIDPVAAGGTGFDHGTLWQDQGWLQARVNGGANPGSVVGFTPITSGWYSLGPNKWLPLPDLPGNCAHYIELRNHPPMRDGAPTAAFNFELDSIYGEPFPSGSFELSELITLDTGAAFTDSTLDLLPADAIIKAVGWSVDTTIGGGGVTSYQLGDATTAGRFAGAQTGAQLTAGATGIGLAAMKGGVATDAAGPTQATAAKLRVTCDGTPTGGIVLAKVWYEKFVAPA